MIIVTTVTYLNHFDNAFHFDDFHTITENPNIRSLKNIVSFFTDGSTISSLPQNQTYRPIVTTSLAFDYWLGNDYTPFFFHLTTFIIFLLQGILIFFFTKKILNISTENPYNYYISGAIALWYMLHPVMAETVNYIIARSDLQSTFFVILAFVLYQYSSIAQKYHLYLIPILIGALAKPLAIMFAPLFFVYVLLFEKNLDFFDLFSKKSITPILQTIKKVWLSFVFCFVVYIFHNTMTPESFTTGSSKTFEYLITQPLSISYYFGSLFLPIQLSADTDWVVLQTVWSLKFLLGILFIIILLIIALYSSKNKKYYPISFGILWFFISLAPTSSIIPLAEVMNDHRMFFPYVGLIISVGYSLWLFVAYLKKRYELKNIYIMASTIILLLMYSIGTYQRNIVWDSEESLWKDVTIKNPKNGRGLMNYGLTQMSKGKYDIAEGYFTRALKLAPRYHYLHTNLGILYNAQGNLTKAEQYFKNAITYGGNYYTPWYYYGNFLFQNSRTAEAIEKLNISKTLSPSHIPTRHLLLQIYSVTGEWKELEKLAIETLAIDNNDLKAKRFLLASTKNVDLHQSEKKLTSNSSALGEYLDLSFKYYQNKQYLKSIEAAKEVLKIQPQSYRAYNNICSALNLLGEFDNAIIACNKALELKPDFQLAQNNLNYVISRQSELQNLITLIAKEPSEANYLSLSLLYYNYELYEQCVKVAKDGIRLFPNSDNLYNNACTGYNALKKWNQAIEVGNKGIKINSNNQLLKNNLNWAIKMKKETQGKSNN